MFFDLRPIALSVLVLSFASHLTAQVLTKANAGLTTPELIQMGNNTSGVVASAQDEDGDGKVDLLVNFLSPSGVQNTTLLRNTGNQNFQAIPGKSSSDCLSSPDRAVGDPSTPSFCTLVDLNGDGMQDRVFAGAYPDGATGRLDYPYIKVMFATGPGTFGTAVRYVLGGRDQFVRAIATGDFNGDGRTDIAVLRMVWSQPDQFEFYVKVSVLYGNQSGGYTTSEIATRLYSTVNYLDLQMVTLDLNGDHKSDLIVHSPIIYPPSCRLLLGSSNGLSLLPPESLPLPRGSFLAAGDFNHDGFGDLVASDYFGGSVHVLYGGGAGSRYFNYFSRIQVLQSNDLGYSTSAIAGDFNGDGLADLALQSGPFESLYSTTGIFIQAQDGSFSRTAQYTNQGQSVPVDMNGDGKLDLVSTNGLLIKILYGDGHGSFSAPPNTGTGSRDDGNVTTADFNRDGKPDIAIALTNVPCSPCGSTVSVFPGSGKGWFLPPKKYAILGLDPVVATGDLNGDGILDLTIMVYSVGVTGQPDTYVLLGKSDGTFASAKGAILGIIGHELFLRDVNNDKKLDIVTAAGVALGRGDGTFSAVLPLSIVYDPNTFDNIAVGDFNHDGKVDILYAGQQDISILLGDGTGRFNAGQVITPANAHTSVGGNPTPLLQTASLNSDDNADFLVGINGGAVITYLGNGDGTFHEGTSATMSWPGGTLTSILVGDFNGDGNQDVAGPSLEGPLAVFLGRSDGRYAGPLIFSAYASGSARRSSVVAADFNQDGARDMILGVPTGFARVLNTGYNTWPKVTSLPPALSVP